jgi:hypothetical protein
MEQRIRERLQEIDASHQAPPLPDSVLASFDRLKRKAEKEVASD